ncbi:MAG TPA: pyridoxal-phosphate dependent enzyme [Blastocatellia bacterium]|nr:pyridoxal-phosphate dependent enzyme [Blastocatellia bacterium]
MSIVEGSSSQLSLNRIEQAMEVIDPVFLNSPQFVSESLSESLEIEVFLKIETVNPIRSFKGRGAEFFLASSPKQPATLVCASAGNFGQGLAYAARKRGFKAIVFAAETANHFKVERMRELGAEVRLFGSSFEDAKAEARRFAGQSSARFVEDGRQPEIAEGAGTISLEVCRAPVPFDAFLVPLGDGALISGIGLWMKAHSPSTRVIGVCAEGAPAMALSWRERRLCSTQSTSTIADGIAVSNPIPESLGNLTALMDEVLTVDDESMVQAIRLAFRHHGLVIEPAGAAGLAAAITYKDRFRGTRIVTPLCGGNLTSDQVKLWLV